MDMASGGVNLAALQNMIGKTVRSAVGPHQHPFPELANLIRDERTMKRAYDYWDLLRRQYPSASRLALIRKMRSWLKKDQKNQRKGITLAQDAEQLNDKRLYQRGGAKNLDTQSLLSRFSGSTLMPWQPRLDPIYSGADNTTGFYNTNFGQKVQEYNNKIQNLEAERDKLQFKADQRKSKIQGLKYDLDTRDDDIQKQTNAIALQEELIDRLKEEIGKLVDEKKETMVPQSELEEPVEVRDAETATDFESSKGITGADIENFQKQQQQIDDDDEEEEEETEAIPNGGDDGSGDGGNGNADGIRKSSPPPPAPTYDDSELRALSSETSAGLNELKAEIAKIQASLSEQQLREKEKELKEQKEREERDKTVPVISQFVRGKKIPAVEQEYADSQARADIAKLKDLLEQTNSGFDARISKALEDRPNTEAVKAGLDNLAARFNNIVSGVTQEQVNDQIAQALANTPDNAKLKAELDKLADQYRAELKNSLQHYVPSDAAVLENQKITGQIGVLSDMIQRLSQASQLSRTGLQQLQQAVASYQTALQNTDVNTQTQLQQLTDRLAATTQTLTDVQRQMEAYKALSNGPIKKYDENEMQARFREQEQHLLDQATEITLEMFKTLVGLPPSDTRITNFITQNPELLETIKQTFEAQTSKMLTEQIRSQLANNEINPLLRRAIENTLRTIRAARTSPRSSKPMSSDRAAKHSPSPLTPSPLTPSPPPQQKK